MTLEEFLLLLPTAANRLRWPPAERDKDGLEGPGPYAPFVSPDLRIVAEQAGSHSVILISAPGAVGKGRNAAGDHVDNRCHGNPKAPNARHTAHAPWINDDLAESHGVRRLWDQRRVPGLEA